MRALALAFFAFALTSPAGAQAGVSQASAFQERRPTEVMLLGVYHFANPGADEFNVEVDDYMAEKRQRELAVVVDRLARFAPDKIFVERRPDYQARLDEMYSDFREGKSTLEALGPNEIYQIGFRLGAWLQHERLFCGDAHGLWLGSAVRDAAERHSVAAYLDYSDLMDEKTEEEGEYLRTHTILENLVLFNRPESILANHSFYNQVAPMVVDRDAEAGTPYQEVTIDGTEYFTTAIDNHHVGAELVGEWYKRNIRSFGTIARQVDEADERILVIIGQGHVRILQHLFGDHPNFVLAAPNDYLADGDEGEAR